MIKTIKASSLLLVISCFLLAPNLLVGQGKAFSSQSVEKDFNYLTDALRKAHFNPYAYISKKEFDSYADSLKSTIPLDSLSALETFNLFQKLVGKLNTGHAELDFPIQDYFPYVKKSGTLFPLELAFEEGKSFVRKNYSDNTTILEGAQLISIDGEPIEKVLEKLYPLVSAERPYYKNAKIEFWSFPRMYWRAYPEQKQYEVQWLKSGKIEKAVIDAIPAKSYENSRPGEILGQDRFFKTFDDIAYLNPGPFSSTAKSDEAHYRKFIDSAFNEISNRNLAPLIIDLRNNSGGHNAFSDYLVAYFADQAFKWASKFMLKSSALLKAATRQHNDTTDLYFKTILEKQNGEIYAYENEKYKPVSSDKRYKGKVYVLINRHSYSMATVTAAMIQDYNWATLVGEETGDIPTLYASQFSFQLPETKISVKIPKGYIVRVNGDESLKGTIPDIKIKDHLLDEEDEILNGLLDMLRQ